MNTHETSVFETATNTLLSEDQRVENWELQDELDDADLVAIHGGAAQGGLLGSLGLGQLVGDLLEGGIYQPSITIIDLGTLLRGK